MKKITLSLILIIGFLASSVRADDGGMLTGDPKLACEAIICLSTGSRPGECQPSIQKFFSIKAKKPGDTIKERIKFLDKCPASNQTPEMQSLVNAIANGAGRCDTASLNVDLQRQILDGDGYPIGTGIDNNLPDYCSAYNNNIYTNFGDYLPKYVGLPERGGYWVNASDYDSALAAYNVRIAQEDAKAAADAAAVAGF